MLQTFEYCTEHSRDEWIEWEQLRSERRERTVQRTTRWGLFGWIVRLFVEIFFAIYWVLIGLWFLVTWVTCIICQIGLMMTGHRILADDPDIETLGVVQSQSKPTAEAFNNALVTNWRDYKESGERTVFRIVDNKITCESGLDRFGVLSGVVRPTEYPPWTPATVRDQAEPVAISFNEERKGRVYRAPAFDMVAADGSRVLAKAADRADFYFTTLTDEYLHETADRDQFPIPGCYTKLDPQYNQVGFRGLNIHRDLDWVDPAEYEDHPSVTAFKFIRLAKSGALSGFLVGAGIGALLGVPVGGPVGAAVGASIGSAVGLLGGRAAQLMIQDIMMLTVRPAVWHLIDARPPFSSGDPPDWVETYEPVAYGGKYFGLCERRLEQAIRIHRVLDIGVGNMHTHVQYEPIHGGEMSNGPAPIHGPMDDFAGYWDGTCNFYLLCEIRVDPANGDDPSKVSYGILWMDEQAYFSERWRLLHPDDYKSRMFRDWALVGDFISGIHGPKNNTAHHFVRDTFWCPFTDTWTEKAERITDSSRMAVARQTVLVTGKCPDENDLIYSINFSYGSCDRTWRWRRYPDGCTVVSDPSYVKTPAPGQSYCASKTIGLRADMTIHLWGKRATGDDHEDGYWVQKYLPADNVHVPARSDLVAEEMPSVPYPHAWQFFTEDCVEKAGGFSHFGVYETVDARSQYYEVEFMGGSDPFPDPSDADQRWIDKNNSLRIGLHGAPWESPSRFNKKTYLTLVRREPFGVIAMPWDKRDDELKGFTGLRRATLVDDLEDASTTLRVRLSARQRNASPPIVQMAKVILDESAGEITIMFYTRITTRVSEPPPTRLAPVLDGAQAVALHQDASGEYRDFADYLSPRYGGNTDPVFPDPSITGVPLTGCPDLSIWRVVLGGFDAGQVVQRPFDHTIWNANSSMWRFSRPSRYLYKHVWSSSGTGDHAFAEAAAYCRADGRETHCTSLWFENVTGHKTIAENTIFTTV